MATKRIPGGGAALRAPSPPRAKQNEAGFIPTITPAEDWDETFVLRLPTHRVAKLRQVDFTFYALHTSLKNEILEEVAKEFEIISRTLQGRMTQDDALKTIDEIQKARTEKGVGVMENLKNNRVFLEDYAMMALVEPQAVQEVDDPKTQVDVSHIPIEDLQFIFEYMWRPVIYLRLFRAQQSQSLEFVERGKNLGSAPKRTNRREVNVSHNNGSQ